MNFGSNTQALFSGLLEIITTFFSGFVALAKGSAIWFVSAFLLAPIIRRFARIIQLLAQ